MGSVKVYYPGLDPEPDPDKKRELRLDQLEAIYRIVHEIEDGSKAALVGAGMGSGKTVVSVEVMLKTKPKRVLICGPRDSYNQWADSVQDQQGTHGRHRLLRINNSSQAGRDNLQRLLDGDDGWFYIGLEMLRAQDWEQVSETVAVHPDIKAFFGDDIGDEVETVKNKQRHTYADMKPVDLLISDESHRHSNQKSNAIKTIRDIPAVGKIALSGTFFGNKFINAWSLCTWLWGKDVIGTKGRFEKDWCVIIPLKDKNGKRVKTPGGFPLTTNLGERNPGEYVQTLPCYVFIATPIGDVPDPEIVRTTLQADELRQYMQMEKMNLAWVPSTLEARAALIADLDLTARNRLRTMALGGVTMVPGATEEDSDTLIFTPTSKSSTLRTAYEVLHRPTWVGQKALILTHSKPFAIETARRIGQKYPTALKTGDVGSAQWEEDKARFMLPVSDPNSIQYLVAVISAVGTSTDGLQLNCSKVLWMSEDDSNVNNIQGANRVWRDGVDLASYEAVKIVQRGTIAEVVLKKNKAHKADVLGSVAG